MNLIFLHYLQHHWGRSSCVRGNLYPWIGGGKEWKVYLLNIFSLAALRENQRYCYSLGCVVVICIAVVVMQKLEHFVISLLLLKIFTWNSEYVFTIQSAIHTIKGDYSKCIFISTGRRPASLCHGPLSVVRLAVCPSVNFFFKHLFLWNY